ncbi:MAG TPA: anti-sigma factor [Pyrinomonadaceae bacterium]|nr:anti-sigma factor [Pyrinomonadaceae bacterium]
MGTHEDYKEMLAAHALGALDSAEARKLAAHLEGCAECRAELESWNETAAALAYTAPLVEPSAELRSRILESIRAEGAQQIPRSVLERDNGKAANAAVKSSQAESNVVPFVKPARRAWSIASRVGAIAASLAFIALVVSLLVLWNRYSTMRQEMARLSARLNQAQGELAREREQLAHEREAIALITQPDARMATLAGTEIASSAHAKFVFDRNTGRAMLMADNLPAAPAGKAYQLWFIPEGKSPVPGQVFTPDASGHVEMSDEVPAEARNATIFAITLEPSEGVPAPTGPKYLLSATS